MNCLIPLKTFISSESSVNEVHNALFDRREYELLCIDFHCWEPAVAGAGKIIACIAKKDLQINGNKTNNLEIE